MKRRFLVVFLGLILSAPVLWAAEWRGPDEVLQAARKGDPEAQLEMGILYEYGFYLPENRPPALAWYMLAADQGNKKAAQRRDALKQRMSQIEVQRAEQLAPTLAPKAKTTQSTQP